ncbi:MAG TPA: glycosyltransferase [Longimicrobiales bacterium]|nr:glycosyltransferase [Longimicrobiales bacterium]
MTSARPGRPGQGADGRRDSGLRSSPDDSPAPDISVVMPVLDGLDLLPHSVGALEASELAPDRWELVVVDDGSRDGTPDWVRDRGHRVLSVVDGPRGPGHARNRGSEVARGRILMFVDVDVCVHDTALERTLGVFGEHPDVGAVFGAYDDRPSDTGFLSQYRNLYHRWVHLRGAGAAETFWAGCGAVRADLFRELGGFDDERFPRPQIEDIELGYRIRDAGWKILLDPGIQGTHMKRWTLGGMLRTDLLDRGVPWMRLLLAAPRTGSLNVSTGERVRTALVGLAGVMVLVAALTADLRWLGAAILALLVNIASNMAVYRWLVDRRGVGFALRSVPINVLYYAVSGVAAILGVMLHWTTGRTWGTARSRGSLRTAAASEPDST